MGKFIRIDMSNKTATIGAVPEQYEYMGGRQLTSQLVSDEVDPKCHPLGDKNKLVIAPGLLSGTSAPCSGRLSVGSKSPLTGGIKESNAGGTVARALAKMGIKAIVIEGMPQQKNWTTIRINDQGVEFLPCDDIVGKGNYETMAYLLEKHGTKSAIMSIGQAGENGMSAATIAINNLEGTPSRHCGRGGLGAVMGSKGIKAIIIDSSNAQKEDHCCQIVDQEAYATEAKEWAKQLIETKKGLTSLGTASLVGVVNKLGGMPTRNFSHGMFDNADKINGDSLAAKIKTQGGKTGHACSTGCVIRCSNIYHDEKGEYLTSGLEYETIALMGSNLDIDNLNVIAELDRLCDDFGVDTMEVGTALGVAMEAGLLPWGDTEQTLAMVKEIGSLTPLGRVMGQGAATFGKVFNMLRVPNAKGQSLSGYDPRVFKGTGVTYATSPMGGDHTAGNLLPGRGAWRNITDTRQMEGQLLVSLDVQYMTSVLDSLGFCIFTGPVPDTIERIANLMGSVYQKPFTAADVLAIGKDVMRTELSFNSRAGFTKEDNRLAEFFYTEKLGPHDEVFAFDSQEMQNIFSDLV